jgi:hypothetical protein
MRFHRLSSFATAAACASLAACGDSTGPKSARPLTVSFSGASSAASSSAVAASSTALSVTAGTDVLVISSAEIVVARAELQRVGGTCAGTAAAGDDAAGADDGCAELELAPRVVSVPVNGSVASALTGDVPAGSYSSLEAKIRPVSAGSGGERRAGSAAFLAAHPDLSGVSVRVKGTYDGRAFTYVGAAEAQLETAFSPALTIDATGSATSNVTVNVDLSSWFRTSSGALVDPASANAGGANSDLVADNIKRSFRAFRDDDRDGSDDGAGHH